AMWHQRLEANRPWLTQWLAHQRRDAFWERASVCEDYAAIRAPVFAVGGWRDGYPNTVFRLVEHLSCPVRGLVGSWAHRFPHLDGPGPAIDFLGECLAWWDRWLKGIENGAENAPAMCAWMLDPSSPLDDSAPGRWVSDTAWPPAGLAPSPYALGPGRLVPGDAPAAGEDDVLTIPAPLAAAFHAGRWCAYEEDVDLAGDQRMDDGAALVFETAPLAEDVEVLGAPVVTLALACDRGQAMVAARLSAVAPDGTVERISYGVLNLSQRESRAEPQPLTPGRRETVTVTLKVAGRRIAAGERLRLALTAGYWPLVWPAPEPAALSLWPAASRLTLPVRPRRAGDGATFGPVRRWAAPAHTVLAPAERQTRVTIDTLTREVALEIVNDAPVIRHDGHGMVFANPCRERYAHRAEDPDSLVAEVRNDRHFRRDIEGAERLDIRIETRSRLTASPTHWCLATTVEAYEGETRVFSRTWDDRIERDHM
ncbi:MAG: CocE/NonD family hydrolase, partial [Pseudomonadota bacterium]